MEECKGVSGQEGAIGRAWPDACLFVFAHFVRDWLAMSRRLTFPLTWTSCPLSLTFSAELTTMSDPALKMRAEGGGATQCEEGTRREGSEKSGRIRCKGERGEKRTDPSLRRSARFLRHATRARRSREGRAGCRGGCAGAR